MQETIYIRKEIRFVFIILQFGAPHEQYFDYGFINQLKKKH